MATHARSELVAALFAALASTIAGAALADSLHPSLTVTRDDGSRECPDSSSLEERVEAMAGKNLFNALENEPPDTWLQVEFVRSIEGYQAVISARGARQGKRTLDDVGPGCASLADAVAITLAILLDPAMAASVDPPPLAVANFSLTPPRRDAPRTDTTPPRLTEHEEKLERRAFGLEASAGASFDVLQGVVPVVEAGLRGGFGDVLVLGAGGGFFFPERVEVSNGSVDVQLPFGYFRGCANLLPRQSIAFQLCLEPMLGLLQASGKNFNLTNSDRSVLWSAVAGVAQAYGPIVKSLSWSVRARVLMPLARHEFTAFDEQGRYEQAFRLPAVGGSLTAGLDLGL